MLFELLQHYQHFESSSDNFFTHSDECSLIEFMFNTLLINITTYRCFKSVSKRDIRLEKHICSGCCHFVLTDLETTVSIFEYLTVSV